MKKIIPLQATCAQVAADMAESVIKILDCESIILGCMNYAGTF